MPGKRLRDQKWKEIQENMVVCDRRQGLFKRWKQAGTSGRYSENPLSQCQGGTSGLDKSHRRIGFTGLGGEGISSPLGKCDTEMSMRKGTLGPAAGEHTYPVIFLHSWLPEKELQSLYPRTP